MKKLFTTLSVAGVVLAGVAASTAVFAHGPLVSMGKHAGWMKLQNNPHVLESQAKLLGISADDLKARLNSGKTFQQIVKDLGITDDQLKARREDAWKQRQADMKTHLQELVTSGKITQAQADKMVERMSRAHEHGLGTGKVKPVKRVMRSAFHHAMKAK